MKTITGVAVSVVTMIALTGLATDSAIAEAAAAPAAGKTTWQQNHPRRTQVNSRLANQNKRITNEQKSGQITKSEAQGLRANDKTIHGEEKAMATQDGGHITKADQKSLNQQLNKNSGAIGK